MSTPVGPAHIGLLGGSFDPPHLGHVLLGAAALSQASIDALWVLPVFRHPHGKAFTADFEHRLRMCELAFGVLQHVQLMDLEKQHAGPSYTVHTVDALRLRYPTQRWSLIMGQDAYAQRHRWHEAERLFAMVSPWVVGREGAESKATDAIVHTLSLPDISSTSIRKALRTQSAKADAFLSAPVRDYIQSHGLYR